MVAPGLLSWRNGRRGALKKRCHGDVQVRLLPRAFGGWVSDKALALAMIHQAVEEMRDVEPQSKKQIRQKGKLGCRDKERLRISAIVWLASARAAMWFERCGLDQSHALGKMEWAGHARELLDTENVLLDCKRTRVLELGLDAVGPIK